jgi:hypothetical protein
MRSEAIVSLVKLSGTQAPGVPSEVQTHRNRARFPMPKVKWAPCYFGHSLSNGVYQCQTQWGQYVVLKYQELGYLRVDISSCPDHPLKIKG